MILAPLFLAAAPAALEAAPSHPYVDASPFVAAPSVLAPPQDEEAAAEEPTWPQWTGSITLGALLSDGNVQNASASANLDIQRRSEHDRSTLRGQWNYKQDSDPSSGKQMVTERRLSGSFGYDYFFTEKFYALGTVGAGSDAFSDIELLWYGGGGAGYQFFETDDVKFNLEGAITYFSQDFISTTDRRYAAAKIAYNVYWQIVKAVRFEQFTSAFPSLETTKDFNAKIDTRFNFSFTEKMFFQIQWVMSYQNNPSPGFKNTDHNLSIGLGWNI